MYGKTKKQTEDEEDRGDLKKSVFNATYYNVTA